MSSGDFYNVQVSDTTSNTFDLTATHSCGTWCNHWNTGYTWYSYPVTKYMYQLICPKDKSTNWCELDQTVVCKKCKSTLKAVSKKVDFEVEVEQ